MSCSLEKQPSGPGLLPPVVHTTVVPFTNYSQWERRSTKAPTEGIKAAVSGKTRAKQQKSLASSKTHRHAPSAREKSIIISTRPQQEDGRTLGSNVKNRTGYTTSQPSTTRSESATRLRLLRMAVVTTKASLDHMRQHKEKLFSINLEFVHGIQSSENNVHADVDKMLEKYTSFKGTLSKLQSTAEEELEKAKEDLQITTDNLEADISELQRRVINTERIVRKKSRELNILLNYKDKEYPLKCMKSEQLREQCELVMEDNAVELEEVEQQITDELDKHRQIMEGVKRNLTTKAAQASLVTMKKSVYEKAVQNQIMEKELELHERKRYELEDAIADLQSDIRRLSKEVEKRNQCRHNPPLSMLGKCLPNTELELDFPRQQQLPF